MFASSHIVLTYTRLALLTRDDEISRQGLKTDIINIQRFKGKEAYNKKGNGRYKKEPKETYRAGIYNIWNEKMKWKILVDWLNYRSISTFSDIEQQAVLDHDTWEYGNEGGTPYNQPASWC